ncbi:DUF5668 domain-containing protein [Sphaerobacter sp.]|uniref:LiaI-LiaF-like domain-containing protein n=1 Tax=Sphaerobacter sp. TaxID=2099654 RepID=UPI001DF63764|nr:DUF5668 domain-containing protein [Sphaerobacter sp.]MBX5443777.1 hypothetical protein [Sphaerobacter sp.]
MMEQGVDRGAVISGLVFIVLGGLFLLDRLGTIDFRVVYVWPILLIGLGLAVLFGGRSER